MKKDKLLLVALILCLLPFSSSGKSMYPYSVALKEYVSKETNKAPIAYLWIPENVQTLKAVIFSQQNMTEEAIFRNPNFQKQMQEMKIGMIWVSPSFTQDWDPNSNCQRVFEQMMNDLASTSGHNELSTTAIIPLGHSAHATFPWNFAAWNNDRTLCIISFHGDAPRTNLCGYGRSNIEWGRTRNIDGIPGLMIEGEYEWWEARVNPALAFRMMYPESCVSFLCDTGRGHFDCGDRTASYIALFIRKAMEQRMQPDGSLRRLNPRNGWLFSRFHSDILGTDGADKGKMPENFGPYAPPAPYNEQTGDKHDCFWYFDEEMATLAYNRYRETHGKKMQYVGVKCNGEYVGQLRPDNAYDVKFCPEADSLTFHLEAAYSDASHLTSSDAHGKGNVHIEVICGPVRQIDATTFRLCPYECGFDNPRRAFNIWLVAVAEPDGDYKGAVMPFNIKFPASIAEKLLKE